MDHGPSVSRIKKPLVVNGRTNVVQATNGDESFVEIIEPPLAANLNQFLDNRILKFRLYLISTTVVRLHTTLLVYLRIFV